MEGCARLRLGRVGGIRPLGLGRLGYGWCYMGCGCVSVDR